MRASRRARPSALRLASFDTMSKRPAISASFFARRHPLIWFSADLASSRVVNSWCQTNLFSWREIDEKKLNNPDGRRDTDADWGKKTYKGTRKDGTTWEKVKKWFGYKLHLLVDSVYEMPLVPHSINFDRLNHFNFDMLDGSMRS